MEDILSRLKSGPVIVADGAMGTMLQEAESQLPTFENYLYGDGQHKEALSV